MKQVSESEATKPASKRGLGLADRHQKVLKCIEQHGPQTYLEIEMKLNVSGVHHVVNYLQKRDLIVGQPKKSGRLRVYEITAGGRTAIGIGTVEAPEAPKAKEQRQLPGGKLEWSFLAPSRPGAMDAFKIKSLSGCNNSYSGAMA